MNREEIIAEVKNLADNYIIDPYIYDVLTDGSEYAENWLNQLERYDLETSSELYSAINSMFCTR